MVQEFRDMMDLSRLFTAPEYEIMILCSVELFPLSADFVDDALSYTENVCDIVVAAKQIRAVVRLEIRAVIDIFRQEHLVLIGIDDIDLRILVQRPNDLVAGILLKRIVMIGQHNEIACRHFDRSIGIAGNSLIFLEALIDDPRVISVFFADDLPRFIGCTAVGQTDFYIGVGLIDKCIHQFSEKLFPRIVERYCDTDLRFIREMVLSLTRQFRVRDPLIMEPVIVARVIHSISRLGILGEICLPLLLIKDDLYLTGNIAELINELDRDPVMLNFRQWRLDYIAGACVIGQFKRFVDIGSGVVLLRHRKNAAAVFQNDGRKHAVQIICPSSHDQMAFSVGHRIDIGQDPCFRLRKLRTKHLERITLAGMLHHLPISTHGLIGSECSCKIGLIDRAFSGGLILLRYFFRFTFLLFKFLPQLLIFRKQRVVGSPEFFVLCKDIRHNISFLSSLRRFVLLAKRVPGSSQSEVRIVIGISVLQDLRPAFPEQRNFLFKSCHLGLGILISAGL